MFHKNVVTPIRSSTTSAVPAQESISLQQPVQLPNPRLSLVPSAAAGGGGTPDQSSSALIDLISVSAHRCSSFFAEAAVLVLVLALLDRFMLKGRMEMGWVLSAFSISLALLAASIATDFTARRWLRHH